MTKSSSSSRIPAREGQEYGSAQWRSLGHSLTLRVALLFLFLSFLTRVVLFGLSVGVADASVKSWIAAFFLGFVSDVATLSIALLPVAAFELFLPRRWPRAASVLLGTAFAVIAFTLIFQMASEIIFWLEFGVRFNFIAVDYLVYTHEVIDNIMQSYPVLPLLSGFAVAALALALWWHGSWKKAVHIHGAARTAVLFALMAACAIAWFSWGIDKFSITRNRYTNEIAGNGLYGLFSAYKNNELDYASYYPVLPAAKLHAGLKALAMAPAYQASPAASASVAAPTRPRHLVMITVESLSADYLGIFGNKNGLTPNMDRLSREGLLFTQLYAAGTRTVRGLESLSLSVPPTPGQSIVRRPHNEDLATLGAALNRQGYHSWYIYGGYGYFDNMNYYFSHNGYQVVDRSDVPANEVGFANAWGMSDEYLFNQAEKLLDKEAGKAPQFLMLMTTSNHRPYTYPDGRIDIKSPGGRDGAVKYTDYAIGKFLKDAEKHAWFKDTVFVIVADHCGSSAGKTSLPVYRYHIPAIVYAPGFVKPQEETRMVSQMDIAPTLMGMLGYSADPHFFGKDVLRDKNYEPRALIANYQEVGYLKGDKLVVLAPRHPARVFRVENAASEKEKQTEVAPDTALVNEAITYYQTAAEAFSRGDMKLPAKEATAGIPPRN
ncbi:MAG: LTA synthase family protein [bacterium]|nr:LTA synthase family protein [bacterium]